MEFTLQELMDEISKRLEKHRDDEKCVKITIDISDLTRSWTFTFGDGNSGSTNGFATAANHTDATLTVTTDEFLGIASGSGEQFSETALSGDYKAFQAFARALAS